MEKILINKKVKSNIFILLSLLLILMSFSNSRNVNAEMCVDGTCLEAPTSNVTDAEFREILNEVKKTAEYKELGKTTLINRLNHKDVVINKAENGNEVFASVGFIFNKKTNSDNLAYVELVYDLGNQSIYAKKMLYGVLQDNGNINISMVINDDVSFSMEINQNGDIIGSGGEVLTQEEFYTQAVLDMGGSEFSTNGWCEWAVGALCGAGGGAGCYALAGVLGLTTGIGGLGLATVCGLIGALGCAGATIAICG